MLILSYILAIFPDTAALCLTASKRPSFDEAAPPGIGFALSSWLQGRIVEIIES